MQNDGCRIKGFLHSVLDLVEQIKTNEKPHVEQIRTNEKPDVDMYTVPKKYLIILL